MNHEERLKFNIHKPSNRLTENECFNVQETINEIEIHLDEQPESIQNMWEEMRDKFYLVKEIQGKQYIFSRISNTSVLSIVTDVKNADFKYKTRIFRFSGSDHQWKALPGKRIDGSYLKGEETNPLHHYVQSAKLHKDIYKVLNVLENENTQVNFLQYLPEPETTGDEYTKHFGSEFEFKENYKTFTDLEWADFQKKCRGYYEDYINIITKGIERNDYSQSSEFYKMIEKNPSEEIQNIREYIDVLSIDEYAKFILGNYSMNLIENMDNYPSIKKLAEIFKENIGVYLEKIFNLQFPADMIPDFSIERRLDTYDKTDPYSKESKNNLHIEEYMVESSMGDKIIYAMAYDDKGRVYIDNIYDPTLEMNNYGIPEKIVQMGHLIYKPEDYKSKTYGIPDKYKSTIPDSKYIDISALWSNLPIIKKFKEELLSRRIIL